MRIDVAITLGFLIGVVTGRLMDLAIEWQSKKKTANRPRLVVIESPYAGNIERNLHYARDAMKDCLHRGEMPIASHLLYTQPGILIDEIPAERKLGIEAGFAWGAHADLVVFYTDLGMSRGMAQGEMNALMNGTPVEYRSLPGWAPDESA